LALSKDAFGLEDYGQTIFSCCGKINPVFHHLNRFI